MISVEKHKKCIEGKIDQFSFDVFYISNLFSKLPTGLPLLKVKGKVFIKDNQSIIKITTSIAPFAEYLFLAISTLIVGAYLINKYIIHFSKEFSYTILPLFVPVFFYLFLMGQYIYESDDCDSFFKQLTTLKDRSKT